jgi:hypothetical protein
MSFLYYMTSGTSQDYIAHECEYVKDRIREMHLELINVANDTQRRKNSGLYVDSSRFFGFIDLDKFKSGEVEYNDTDYEAKSKLSELDKLQYDMMKLKSCLDILNRSYCIIRGGEKR